MANLEGKRIGLLSTWPSRRNGGVFEAVVQQTNILRELGAVPVILGVRDAQNDADLERFGDADIALAEPNGPGFFSYARGLKDCLRSSNLDLLHLHGIWQYPTRAAARWQKETGGPLVISPHGMLDPWIVNRNSFKKDLAKFAYERLAWKRATAFHALTADEAHDIERQTKRKNVAHVVPNAAPPIADEPRTFPDPIVVYLGRIHTKKNVNSIPFAWIHSKGGEQAGSRLLFAGWGDEDEVFHLRDYVHHFGQGMEFLGPVFGQEKGDLLSSARFVILPSASEGLPMALLEAWAAGTPTIQSAACHLPEGFAAGAALETGTRLKEMSATLVKALSIPEAEWQKMSEAARSLAAGDFSLRTVADRWKAFYNDALT